MVMGDTQSQERYLWIVRGLRGGELELSLDEAVGEHFGQEEQQCKGPEAGTGWVLENSREASVASLEGEGRAV